MAKLKVLVGEKFGRWTVIEDLGMRMVGGDLRTFVKIRCDCGTISESIFSTIKGGYSKSCGCLRRDLAKEWGKTRTKTHGQSYHPLYRVWSAMIERCRNKNSAHYHNYGGRGVKICEEWVGSFEQFYNWAIPNGWERGLELDKDTNGNGYLYSPETCCFLTKKQNNRFKRTTVNVTFNGITKCAADWAASIGLSTGAFCYRVKNWPVDKLLIPPIEKYKRRRKSGE